MPKNPNVKVLKRWQDLDRYLSTGKLFVASFARKWEVDVKTIRRDLDAFEELGQKIEMGYESELREHYHRYAPGTMPLFSATAFLRLEHAEKWREVFGPPRKRS